MYNQVIWSMYNYTTYFKHNICVLTVTADMKENLIYYSYNALPDSQFV